jgi:tetratricopeptide (TPR) repeat protein
VLIGGTVLAVVVASLARDSEPAPQASAARASDDPLGFFERRVEEHPDDLAARLDLAHRYLDAGMVEDALSEYAVALELDPDDAEALAHVGIILYQNGRPEAALESVDRALSTDPRYPEGLFIRGVILLRGLDRPEDAISAFETYLDAAPFGVERQTAKDLIAEARAATTRPDRWRAPDASKHSGPGGSRQPWRRRSAIVRAPRFAVLALAKSRSVYPPSASAVTRYAAMT